MDKVSNKKNSDNRRKQKPTPDSKRKTSGMSHDVEDKSITLVAVGDISFHGELSKGATSHEIKQQLDEIKRFFQGADLIFGNLECVFGEKGTKSDKLSVVLTSDSAWVPVLKGLGFNMFSMANNHTMDMGPDGLMDTITILGEHGLPYVGVGKNIDEATEMKILNVKGYRIGFLAFCQDDEDCIATRHRTGGAPLTEEVMHKAINNNRALVDYLIVSLHMGMEITEYPSPRQIEMCRGLINRGVDVVLGHHPHVPQGYEKYQQGLIIYSLGNFIFDMLGGTTEGTRSGYIYKISMADIDIKVREVVPYKINEKCIPQLQHGVERDRMIAYLQEISAQLSNQVFIMLYWYKMARWYGLMLVRGLYYQVVKKKRYRAPYVFLKLILNPGARYILVSCIKSFFCPSSFGQIGRFKRQ